MLNKEYGNGLLSEKLMGFVGVPYNKIYHNPLILNASSLTAFYQFLDTDDIRYIVIQRQDLNTTKYTNPVKFAIDNFPIVYQDNELFSFKGSPINWTHQNPDVAVIYEPGYKLHPRHSILICSIILVLLTLMKLAVQIEKNGSLILSNNETNPTIVWSNLENKKINYIETEFKIIQENKPKNKTEIKWKNDSSLFQQLESTQFPNNNLGIRWNDNQSEYSLLLTTKGLQLSTTRTNGTNGLQLSITKKY